MIQLLVLNYILKNNNWDFIEDNSLDESYFSCYQKEFAFLKSEYDEFNSIPSIEIFLNKFPVFNVVNVTDTEERLLSDLRLDRMQRATAEIFTNARNVCLAGDKVSISNFLQNAATDLSNIAVEGQSIKMFTVDNLVTTVKDNYLKDLYATTYSTGLESIDKYIGGWEKDSDYVVIAGRPGHGKSMLMCKFAAEQLKAGKRVGYYSGEMPARQITERLIAAIYGLSLSKIFYKDKSIQASFYNCLNDFERNFNSLYIVEPKSFGNKYPTAVQLESFCKQAKLDVLFVDQQSLLADTENSKQFFEKAANISRQLKAIRDRLNIPVITAVQLNRTKIDDGKNDTVQIAGSDVIGQDATKVIILNKENAENSSLTKCTVSIAKNRTGKTGFTELYVDLDKCSWKEDLSEYDSFREAPTEEYIDEGGYIF